MARTIKVVYANGVFRPLEPVFLDEGTEMEMYLPFEPNLVTPEERQKTIEEMHEAFDQLSDEEWAEIEAVILGPERMAALKRQKEGK